MFHTLCNLQIVVLLLGIGVDSKSYNLILKQPSSTHQLLPLQQQSSLLIAQSQQHTFNNNETLPTFKELFKQSFKILQQLQQDSLSNEVIFQNNMCYACKNNSMTPDTTTPTKNTPDSTTKETDSDKNESNMDNDLSNYVIQPYSLFTYRHGAFCINNTDNDDENNTVVFEFNSMNDDLSVRDLLLASLFGTFLFSFILIALIYLCLLMKHSKRKKRNYSKSINGGLEVKGNNKYNIFNQQLSNSTTFTQVSMCFESPQRLEIDEIIEELVEKDEVKSETAQQIQQPFQTQDLLNDKDNENINLKDKLIISDQEPHQLEPELQHHVAKNEHSTVEILNIKKIKPTEKPTSRPASLVSEETIGNPEQFQKDIDEIKHIEIDQKDMSNCKTNLKNVEPQKIFIPADNAILKKIPPPPPPPPITKPSLTQQVSLQQTLQLPEPQQNSILLKHLQSLKQPHQTTTKQQKITTTAQNKHFQLPMKKQAPVQNFKVNLPHGQKQVQKTFLTLKVSVFGDSVVD